MAKKSKRKSTASKHDGPTPERLAKEAIEPRRGLDGATRLLSAPLARLFARKLLSKDAGENLRMFDAGERVYAAFRLGGLDGLKAFDFEAVGGGSGAKAIPFSPAQASARDDLRRLIKPLSKDEHRAVMRVCVHEESVESVGRQISNYKDPKQARAVGLHVLCAGLRSVAERC